MITSTDPAGLKALMAPLAERPTVTWFGVGGLDGIQFRFDESGLSASAGQTVRKLAAVGLTAVVLVAIATALLGIVQFPLVPHTWNVTVSPGPIGTPRGPTFSVARVSASRHGVMGTNVDGVAGVAAPASP